MDREKIEQLDDLLGALRDGSTDDSQMARLDALLAGDPEAQRYYLDFIDLCTDLRQYYGLGRAAAGSTAARPSLRLAGAIGSMRRWPRLAGGLALAAAVALAASLLTTYFTPVRPLPLSVLAERDGVAVLTRVADARWRGTPLPSGATLQPGRLALRSGLAQIEFYSGATVVLEGPVEFEIVSAHRSIVHRGKLRAHVPQQAQGFTIAAPGVDVVDLGTEFALDITENGRPEIHVFDGEVRLDNAADLTGHRLTTGQALRLGGPEAQPFAADHTRFVSPMGLVGLADETLERRRAHWYEHSRSLERDPSVVLYYTFENQQPWDRTVRNMALDPSTAPQGAIVGAKWSEGRWPGKGALEFKRTSDRIRIEVPGRHESMTFAAWVRFDGFDRWLSALMLTDGWVDGQPHWQVSWDGEIILGVATGPTKGVNYYSTKGVLTQADLGRWVHLTTVYNAPTQTVTHYVDGRAFKAEARPLGHADLSAPLHALEIGKAEIGNWSAPRTSDINFSVRNLNGRIDEFIVFARGLSGDQVRSLYEAGRPHP
jgi:hypothetical protein